MANSNNRKKNLITPEKAAWFIPVFISSCISILLIIFFVIPKYVKSNLVNLELIGLVKKKNELANLKSQYKIINQKFDKLNQEKLKIVELISGKSNLDTLLAKLGEIAKENNVEFISISPRNVIIASNNSSEIKRKKNKKEVNLNIDPLLVEGTKKYLIDFTFKTKFVDLLSFIRELEFLENIILIDNINLKLISESSNSSNSNAPQEILEISLAMTFYGKI
tara:strand:- start:58 stop:723 length:666 start_codon:yes stop_codon:yes gene_type:complete